MLAARLPQPRGVYKTPALAVTVAEAGMTIEGDEFQIQDTALPSRLGALQEARR